MSEAGYTAYLVGGCVRDFLLKSRAFKDFDIVTDARPDDLCRLFPKAVTVGKQFGVIKVPVPDEPGILLEIATFRRDLEYKDHRHPKGVIFAGPEEDARRRDFTINGLFFDPKTSRILDTVDGVEDLKARRIRAIGDADARFQEDALRLLRAVRFSVRFDFSVEAATRKAILGRAKLVQKVSHERVYAELTAMWLGPRPEEALRELEALGLLTLVLPEVATLKGLFQPSYPGGQVLDHTVQVMKHLSAQATKLAPELAWAACLLDVGKPQAAERSGGKNFNGHEIQGALLARNICSRLRMSRQETDAISLLIESQLKIRDAFQMREATLMRLVGEEHFGELLALHRADATATDGNLAAYEFCMAKYQELRSAEAKRSPKLLSGEDLIQLGLKPGPKFSEILRSIEDLTIERKLRSKEEALEYVIKHFI